MKQSIATIRFRAVKISVQLLLALVLAGCGAKVAEMAVSPQAVPLFDVYAQVTVHPPEKAKQRFFVIWRRFTATDGLHDEVEIRNPLGNTQALLNANPQRAVLEYGGETLQAVESRDLAQRVIGIDLPVDAIGYWIIGRAAPGEGAEEHKNSNGTVSNINQFGWNIMYLSYNDDKRPKKINMDNNDGLLVEVDIRRWL